MTVTVRPAEPRDAEAWILTRQDLWPEEAEGEHRHEVDAYFRGSASEPAEVLLAMREGRAVGFAELSIRPFAEGCQRSGSRTWV